MRYFLTICLFIIFAQNSFAQSFRPGPGRDYDIGWAYFKEGNFSRAAQSFHADLKNSTFKFGTTIWVDAICANAMIGECAFQMSNFEDANAFYSTAIRIFLAHPRWATQLQNVPGVQPTARPDSPWGKSFRNNPIGNFPKTYQIEVGERYVGNAIEQGQTGVMMQAKQMQINAPEIMKCLALAIRHRAEILGPTSHFDSLNEDLVQALNKRPAIPNHWTGAWIEVLYGLARAARGDGEAALTTLGNGALLPGDIDHHLTPTAFLESGKILLKEKKYDKAAVMFYEAGISAHFYFDPIVLEESIRYASEARRYMDAAKPPTFLEPALAYVQSDRDRSNAVLVTLLTECADVAFQTNRIADAKKFLSQAQGIIKNNDLRNGLYAARVGYFSALGNFFSGSVPEGERLAADALSLLYRTSTEAYHLSMIDTLFLEDKIRTTGTLTPRLALECYAELLGEPNDLEWIAKTPEKLAFRLNAPLDSYERWMFLALSLKNTIKAFEIAEQIRSQRFFSTIPLGGRLLSLRYLLESPVESLPNARQLDRQLLLKNYSIYEQMSKESADVQKKIVELPIIAKDDEQAAAWQAASAALANLSAKQEALLRAMSLMHIKSPRVFPPNLALKEIQAALPEGTSMLTLIEIIDGYHAFLISAEKMEYWRVGDSATIRNAVSQFLQLICLRDSAKPITLKELADEKWKLAGQTLLTNILGNEKRSGFKELVVVPDGVFWYLPFEALTVNMDNKGVPLIAIEGTTLRYAPCASLGIPTEGGRRAIGETLIVQGKLNPKDLPAVTENAVTRMQNGGLNIVSVNSGVIPVPLSIWRGRIRQLVILDEITINPKAAPTNWSPFSGAKFNGPISDWLTLPFGAPNLILLPTFRTPAEIAFRQGGNGQELFLSAMTLKASGVQMLAISRWKTGGRASLDLMSAFLAMYKEHSAAEAWKKAVFSVAGNTIVADEELKIKVLPEESLPIANHPFFWGATMILE